MQVDTDHNLGAGANMDTNDENQVVYLPLTDSEGKLLPVHFLSASEVQSCIIGFQINSNSVTVKGALCNKDPIPTTS